MDNDFDFDAMYELAAQQDAVAPSAIEVVPPVIINSISDIDPEQGAVRDIKSDVRPVASVGSVVPVPLAEKRKELSFHQPVTMVPVLTPEGKRKFITRAKVIDKFNIKRERIELTPSVCQVCAFDVTAKYFGSWHQTPAQERPRILEALQKHIEVAHPLSNASIVDEDQIAKRWLGNNKF